MKGSRSPNTGGIESSGPAMTMSTNAERLGGYAADGMPRERLCPARARGDRSGSCRASGGGLQGCPGWPSGSCMFPAAQGTHRRARHAAARSAALDPQDLVGPGARSAHWSAFCTGAGLFSACAISSSNSASRSGANRDTSDRQRMDLLHRHDLRVPLRGRFPGRHRVRLAGHEGVPALPRREPRAAAGTRRAAPDRTWRRTRSASGSSEMLNSVSVVITTLDPFRGAGGAGVLPRFRSAAGPTRRPVRSPSSPPSSLPGVSGSWPPTGTAGTSRRSPARPPSRSASDRTGARHGMSWERVSSRSWVIGPFRVGRGPDWGDSCEGSGVSGRLRGAAVTLSPAGAVVSRKTSASRRRSKAA